MISKLSDGWLQLRTSPVLPQLSFMIDVLHVCHICPTIPGIPSDLPLQAFLRRFVPFLSCLLSIVSSPLCAFSFYNYLVNPPNLSKSPRSTALCYRHNTQQDSAASDPHNYTASPARSRSAGSITAASKSSDPVVLPHSFTLCLVASLLWPLYGCTLLSAPA